MKGSKVWMLAAALGLFVAVPFAGAKEDEVSLKELPKAVHHEIDKEVKEAKDTHVYHITGEKNDYYLVHYTDPAGKRMQVRVNEEGKLLAKGPTKHQRHKNELEAAKTAEERAKLEAQYQAEREAEDRAAFQAWQAAQAKAAATPAPSAPGKPRLDAGSQSWQDLKELSQEYNATKHERLTPDQVPPAALKTLDQEALNTSEKDYFRYVVDGQTFYSAHYTTAGGRRWVARVSDAGKLLGRHELLPAEAYDERLPQRTAHDGEEEVGGKRATGRGRSGGAKPQAARRACLLIDCDNRRGGGLWTAPAFVLLWHPGASAQSGVRVCDHDGGHSSAPSRLGSCGGGHGSG